MKTWIALFTFALSSIAYAENFWTVETSEKLNNSLQSQPKIRQTPDNPEQETVISPTPIPLETTENSALTVDLNGLKSRLLSLQDANRGEFKDIELPLPNGTFATYRFTLSSIAAKELLEKYPSMQAFKGVDINNPNNTGRFDIANQGFRGMFNHNGKRIFIDPIAENSTRYSSYFSDDIGHIRKNFIDEILKSQQTNKPTPQLKGSSSDSLRTFRLAITASYPYTEFHSSQASNYFSDPKTVALEEIHTLVNRLNDVFQNDLSIKLELIGRQDELIITQASNDPFHGNSFLDLSVNQTFIDNTVGSQSYDIGHLLSTQAEAGIAGRAKLGSACQQETKAQGFTGIDTPTYDSEFFSFVAHEIGHQFNAEHTFSSTGTDCIDQLSLHSAYEPGSGSTIMSYAGSCGIDNLQNASDNYFHAHSIEQITNYITSGNGQCGTVTTSNNAHAFVDAGLDFVIPANTPFMLRGTANDSDNDLLSYTWEQLNLDSGLPQSTSGDGPLFRSFPPSSSSVRYLPKLTSIANNTLTIGESYPTTSRTLTFRITARQTTADPANAAFGTSYDDVDVIVDGQSGPFRITQPSTDVEWKLGETYMVTWDVANTDLTPVMCTNVDLLLSSSNGERFSDVFLEKNTPNDGQTTILISSDESHKNARLIIQCNDQRFFAMSQANINLNKASTGEEKDPFNFSNTKSGSASILFLVGLGLIFRLKILNKQKQNKRLSESINVR
ncbi:reprolysin-like metallopeptidase [Marinomonas algicola]|uniref:reprolysin-like metallopeptidase n=1 Tax=Marinomonas algicola TaxID=2773454 RepID=UPI00174C2993|nr:zinc-dependent metalloprotease family protein [Marinomonas algicola]